MPTREEIEDLKQQWLYNPLDWDIETTEGFEDHRDELLAFRKEKEAEWEAEYKAKITARATELECSFKLAEYIDRLERVSERRREQLEERLDRIEDSISSDIEAAARRHYYAYHL
jgi:hypothetical protein